MEAFAFSYWDMIFWLIKKCNLGYYKLIWVQLVRKGPNGSRNTWMIWELDYFSWFCLLKCFQNRLNIANTNGSKFFSNSLILIEKEKLSWDYKLQAQMFNWEMRRKSICFWSKIKQLLEFSHSSKHMFQNIKNINRSKWMKLKIFPNIWKEFPRPLSFKGFKN